jgi:hypothetical protein
VGKTMGKNPLGQQMIASSDSAFETFLDDFCGTPPGKIPWPWPWPGPWVPMLAAELVSVANTQTGAMKEGLTQFAGRVAAKGFSGQAQAQSKTASAAG